MRLRFLLLPTVLAVVAGCSSSNEAPSLGEELGPTGDVDAGQSTPAPDDHEGTGEPVEPDAGTAGAPSAAPSRGNCSPGGLYCGGDKVVGDAKTLYKCNGPGTPTVVETCPTSCTVNTGMDDSCTATATAGRIASPVPGKGVTYPFGVKNSGYAAGYHTGDDYATPTGSSAIAVRSGTIRWSNDNGGAYGKWIGLDADNGRTYVYCHLSNRLVTVGTKIVAGQVLAKTGATGNVTGPHLHFEDHPRGPFVYAQVRKPTW